jgi:hypothetical protein
MSAADIQRLAAGKHPELVRTLFVSTEPPTVPPRSQLPAEVEEFLCAALDELEAVTARVGALEERLAPESEPDVAVGHTVFVCRPSGYGVLELDGPPPELGAVVTLDDERFVVAGHRASPFPDDRRPCAVLEAAP